MRAVTEILSSDNIERALGALPEPIEKYLAIQRRVAQGGSFESDPSFRRQFNSFYRVRRGPGWQEAYYGLMKSLKGRAASFELCLAELLSATGRIEASFASKLSHTLDADQPIIDSVVLKNLNLRLPAQRAASRMEQIVDIHRRLKDCYGQYLSSREGKDLLRLFRARYPQPEVTDVKALDLVLWQIRP